MASQEIIAPEKDEVLEGLDAKYRAPYQTTLNTYAEAITEMSSCVYPHVRDNFLIAARQLVAGAVMNAYNSGVADAQTATQEGVQ